MCSLSLRTTFHLSDYKDKNLAEALLPDAVSSLFSNQNWSAFLLAKKCAQNKNSMWGGCVVCHIPSPKLVYLTREPPFCSNALPLINHRAFLSKRHFLTQQ